MQIKGKITHWDDDKGFGFITPAITSVNGKERIFFHITALNDSSQRPNLNRMVTYTLSTDDKSRACATNVTLIGWSQIIKWKDISRSTISAIFFLSLVGILVLIGKLSFWIFSIYLVASVITFIMYALDKSAARNDTWRTPESTLHFLSLAGGWPGALIAQQRLRHKSQKQSFRLVFWLTVVLNCAVFLWLFT